MTKMSKTPGDQYFLLHPNRPGKMDLPVPIDEDAMHRLNARLANVTSERARLESKKKDMVAPINKRLAELRAEEQRLVQERESGQTTREVAVEEVASFEKGIAWMVRKDTKEEVPDTRRQLTPQERNSVAPARGEGEEPVQLFHRRGEEEPVSDESEIPDEVTSTPGSEVTRELTLVREEEPLPEDGDSQESAELKFYELNGLPGWRFFVDREGRGWFRGPNVEAAASIGGPGDFGPFEWDEANLVWDSAPGGPSNEWLGENEQLLETADALKKSGTITERVKVAEARKETEGETESEGKVETSTAEAQPASEDGDDDSESEEPIAAGAKSPADIAASLSKPAEGVLRALAGADGPLDNDTIRVKARCSKVKTVCGRLLEKNLVEAKNDEKTSWVITDLGRRVVAEKLPKGKKK